MNLSTTILGTTTVERLRERGAAAVLTIGNDAFTRGDLSRVECFNFLAAARLSRILTRELAVKNTRDLFDRIPPTALALPELGAISLAVLGAAFEARGLGGDAPLEAWVQKHASSMVTFATLKARDRAERQQDARATKNRKAARRRQAHARRVERLETRRGVTV